jgi:hypothetical protein
MFTDDIDAWYERGRYSWNDPERAVAIRFDRGRLLEEWDDGGSFEMGVITAWEPGERLAFGYRNVHLPAELETEVEVRFEAVPAGTRVTLEHRGLEQLPDDEYARWRERAWSLFMKAFARYAGESTS